MKDHFDFEGVRFSPKAIVFNDIQSEEERTGYFTLRNVGNRPVKITVINPKSKFFRVLSSPDNVMLSPGLKVNSGVKLRPGAKESSEMFLVIHINDKCVFYPILVHVATAKLFAIPTFLDFGTVDQNTDVLSKTVILHNTGALTATFSVDVTPESTGLEVNPLEGTVPGKGHFPLEVKVPTTYAGVNHLYFWIKSEDVVLIYVKVTVIKPYLEVHHPCTSGECTLLCFPPLYYGTQFNQTLIVQNISANDSMFAVLASIGDEVIEIKQACERNSSYKMFTIEPMEGRMKPLEGRIFTFSFKPICDSYTEGQDSDHLVHLTIERILYNDCRKKVSPPPVEWQKELATTFCKADECRYPGSAVKTSATNIAPAVSTVEVQSDESQKKIKIFLYGKALVPSVKLRPTEMIIESVPMGSTAERELCLTNTGELPIHVSFIKAPNIFVTPSHIFLKPTKSVEVLLTVKPTATGDFQQKLWFTLLAKTWPRNETPSLVKVGCVSLPLAYGSPAITTIPKTVFTMGITPIITNEIGIVNERITFASGIEKPRAALVTPLLWQKVSPRRSRFPRQESEIVVDTQSEKSLHNECEALYDSYTSSSDEENANVESSVPLKRSIYCYKQKVIQSGEYINGRLEESLIAFPNDRSKSLRPWPKHKITRAIFTGAPRYSSPADEHYTYTNKEFLLRQAHENFYLTYIRTLPKAKESDIEEEKEDVKPEASKFLKWNQENDESLLEILELPVRPERKLKETAKPSDVLIPLSPVQLFNIKVSPRTLDLGKVAERSAYGKTINVHNINSFPVQLHFVEGYPGITIPSGAIFVVKPGEISKFDVICSVGSFGVFKGNIEYLVNEQHKSVVPITAQMLPKTIKLDSDSIVFPIQHAEDAFPRNTCSVGIRNDLKVDVRYVWEQAEEGAFSVRPQEGVVPAESMLFCEVLYNPSPKYLLTAELPVLSESNEISILKCEKMLRRPSIILLPHELELDEIPLNITKMTKLCLLSFIHQPLSFVVSNPMPLPGVIVEPPSGILPAQGVKELQLSICFGALLKFCFTLVIKIPGTDVSLKLPVTGHVGTPKVTIKPQVIEFGRVAAGSISYRSLIAENIGNVEAEVSFMFKSDSEFCISTSCNKHCMQNESFTLQPGLSKTFNLLLIAKSVSSYDFTLPIVLNGILGPPEKHNSDSFMLQTYLETNNSLYDSSMLHTKECNESLPAINVAGTVGKALIEFSKKQFHFVLLTDDEDNSHTKENLCIRNKTADRVSLRIDCEGFCEHSPFLMVKTKGSSITREDNSIYTTLEYNEYAVFKVAFIPEVPGFYKSEAAIYVTDYSSKEPFCYISFDGTWKPPTIQLQESEIFFPPVPLGIQLTTCVKLKLLHYIAVPYITAKIEPVLDDNDWNMAETINVDFADKENEVEMKEGVGYLWATVSFRSEQPVSLNTVVTFEDEYETWTQMRVVATADNCILTTHAFLIGHCVNPYFFETDSQEDNPNKKTCGMLSPANHITDEPVDHQTNELSCQTACVCCKVGTCKDDAEIAYYISKDNGVSFPEFPHPDDHSTYAYHMHNALIAAEQWLREWGLHGTYGASIPEGLTIVADSTSGNRGQPQILFDLLTNLAGKSILSYFPTSELPADNVERVQHLHRIYIHLVLFLSAQGGSIAHVRPKHLLAYDDYLVYMKSKVIDPKNIKKGEYKNFEILDAHKFKLLSTQSWLDIVLQLQKVFSLRKITVQTVDEVSRCLKLPTQSVGSTTHRTVESEYYANSSEKDIKDSSEEGPVDPLTSNVYSTAECTLLAWLGAHYSAQRQQLWTDSRSPLQRTVNNFSSDLQDSLVLSAVTASHCPYLIPLYLSKVLPKPKDLSQLYHNARCLCDAWDAVGLGFTVTAANIVNASPPFTVGLVAHLYEFLPGVYPQETIHFSVELGGEITHEILLQNLSKKRIAFFPRIIGDPANLFSIEYKPGPYRVSASQRIRIPIKYTARKIDRVKVTVIFCGELSSPTPADSVALNLEGKTIRLKESATFKVSVPIYHPLEKQLKIHVPYAVPNTKYDIYLTHYQPTPETGMNNAQPWSALSKAKIPRSLFLKESYLTLGEEEQKEPLHTLITCVLPTQIYVWLIFTNESVGDFIIKLDITPTSTTAQEFLGEIALPSHCSCEMEQDWKNSACPRTATIQIPCCNHSLWSAAVEILRNTMGQNEFEFWMQFTETRIGLLLLNLYISQKVNPLSNELSPIFRTNVTYTINTSAPKYVKVQQQITITDTLSQGTVQILFHVEEGAPSPLSFLLTMTSTDGREIRTYQVCIKEIPSEHDFLDSPTLRQLSKEQTSKMDAKSKTASLKNISHHKN